MLWCFVGVAGLTFAILLLLCAMLSDLRSHPCLGLHVGNLLHAAHWEAFFGQHGRFGLSVQKACHGEVSAETPGRAAAANARPQHTRADTLYSSCTIAGSWGGRCTGGGAVRGVHREQSRHCVPVRAHVCVRALCHRPAVMPHLPQALPANSSIPDLRWQVQLSYSQKANPSPVE